MKKPQFAPVEIDMVPLIDIISLLLMFLIIVGDTTASSSSVQMKLPTASEAMQEWPLNTKNRVVVQMKKENEEYFAVLSNTKHDMAGGTLKEHLGRMIEDSARTDPALRRPDGTWNIPVKLRIPEECPMLEVEKVLATVANLQLVDIQYAAAKK